MRAFLKSIGTAVPEHAIPQQKVLQFMLKAHQLKGAEAKKLDILYRATGIHNRYSVLEDYSRTDNFTFFPDNETLTPFPGTNKRMEKYREEALKLSLAAIKNCLSNEINPGDITHLITVSCTGMYAPGLDIDIVRKLELPLDIERTAINFMGCYAAFNAIKVAAAICESEKPANVLVVCTELCTLHFQHESTEDNILSNAIFGDGSAAALITNHPSKNGFALRLDHSYSRLEPSGKDEMAWDIGDTGFEMTLRSTVPEYLASGVPSLLEYVTETSGFKNYDLYALHPGGKRILQVLEKLLNISPAENRFSREVLQNYGNMSSVSILFVLSRLMESLESNNENNKILCLAFGPGLTMESMIFTATLP